jgi:hypothetical protein
MREQVKEFAKKHFCKTEYDNGNAHDRYEFSEDELDEFVMFIVSECVHAVVNTSDRYRREYFADKIKEHFGVK